MIYQFQGLLSTALGIAAFLVEVYALVDAVRYREDAYRAAGKLTRGKWLVILGLAVLVGFIFLFSVFSLLSLASVVAAAVYLVDVRPALRQVMGNARSNGPYGPW